MHHLSTAILISLVVGAGQAHAESTAPASTAAAAPPAPTHFFVEAFGNWGVNLGQTEYVPNGRPGSSKHPFATGFGAGATVGFMILPAWLSLIADYRFGHTSTRKGEVDGVLTDAQGTLNFHLITAGVRMEHLLGPGRMYGQMQIGVLLPFHTTREVEYAPQLAAIGITGEGTLVDNYGVGFGAQAELGYHCDVWNQLYVGGGLRVGTFQASNAGKDTELDNFVVDFAALPPVPVTTTIHHGTNGPVTPTTYSVQDVRINVAVGYRF